MKTYKELEKEIEAEVTTLLQKAKRNGLIALSVILGSIVGSVFFIFYITNLVAIRLQEIFSRG